MAEKTVWFKKIEDVNNPCSEVSCDIPCEYTIDKVKQMIIDKPLLNFTRRLTKDKINLYLRNQILNPRSKLSSLSLSEEDSIIVELVSLPEPAKLEQMALPAEERDVVNVASFASQNDRKVVDLNEAPDEEVPEDEFRESRNKRAVDEIPSDEKELLLLLLESERRRLHELQDEIVSQLNGIVEFMLATFKHMIEDFVRNTLKNI